MQLFHGINVVSSTVSDLDQARRFYAEVLGFGTPIYCNFYDPFGNRLQMCSPNHSAPYSQ
jgi:hypothetical protein